MARKRSKRKVSDDEWVIRIDTSPLKRLTPNVCIIFILIFALVLRLVLFVGIGYNDDSVYTRIANEIALGRFKLPPLPNINVFAVRAMVNYPMAFLSKIFGVNDYSASAFFIACSIGAVAVTYEIGKTLFSWRVGILAAFLYSFFPLDLIYSTQIGPDVPLSFFAGLTIMFFLKGEQSTKKKYFLLSGVSLGLVYLTKSAWISVAALLMIAICMSMLHHRSFKREYVLVLLGFLFVFAYENTYTYIKTGEWFYNIRVNKVAVYDMRNINGNPDQNFYLKSMFRKIDPFGLEFFGYFYFVVVFAIFSIFIRNIKPAYFLILWLLFLFLVLNNVIAYMVAPRLIERMPRFLTLLSIPISLIIAVALDSDKKFHQGISLIVIVFLLSTSISDISFTIHQLRRGMDDIRLTRDYLIDKTDKPIYSCAWVVDKLGFFFGYREDVRLIAFNNFKSADRIHDAYVVINGTAQCAIYHGDIYPEFNRNPPETWQKMKTIHIPHIGIFEEYDPVIYYAP